MSKHRVYGQCSWCSKDITTRRNKFCNQVCYGLSQRVLLPRDLRPVCKHCQRSFKVRQVKIKGWVLPQYCGDGCRRLRRSPQIADRDLCRVEGCNNKRLYRDGICNSCYYRRKRTGSLERRVYTFRSVNKGGYITLRGLPNHPLASPNGNLYEHRKVLYDHIGEGDHSCFWCHKRITWIKGKCRNISIVPDHLDGNKHNNDIGNLVPSCNPCNSARGLFMKWVEAHKDDPVLWEMYEKYKGTPCHKKTTAELRKRLSKKGKQDGQ